MRIFLIAETVILYMFSAFMCFLKETHMFQLNSYNTVTHIKWLSSNKKFVLSNFFAAVFSLISLVLFFFISIENTALVIVCQVLSVIFLILGLSNRKKGKDKTPLVFTARVKRLFATYSVLHIGALVLFTFLFVKDKALLAYFLLLFVWAVIPFVILLSNLINAPIEKAVKKYYLNDAVKILRSCPDLTVVGITGSYGKTSMKYFLSTILKQKYNVLIPPKNYNTPMGIVKTVREELKGYHEIFVCEMGAKNVGEIKELCDIVHPKHGIITSIGPQHLESFKSIDNIIKTKFELNDNLCGGKIFLNCDNEYIRNNLPDNCVKYGVSEDADYRGINISVSRDGTDFSIVYPDKSVHDFHTVLIGEHNVTNICGAVAMAKELQVDDSDIINGVAKIVPVPHRLELKTSGNLTIIDDAYNSNPSGCRAALSTLKYFDEMKILVTPGMVELGEKEEELNCEFGREAAEVCDFIVLVGEKQTRPILSGLKQAGYCEDNIYIADSIGDAMRKVYNLQSDRKKCVLLENDLPDNY